MQPRRRPLDAEAQQFKNNGFALIKKRFKSSQGGAHYISAVAVSHYKGLAKISTDALFKLAMEDQEVDYGSQNRKAATSKKWELRTMYNEVCHLVFSVTKWECVLSRDDISFIYSSKGCERQSPHVDSVFSGNRVPVSVIVCLSDFYSLWVWPKSHVECEGVIIGERVVMSFGDVIIFRSDLVHCGDSCDVDEMFRVHMFFDVEECDRDKGVTVTVDSEFLNKYIFP